MVTNNVINNDLSPTGVTWTSFTTTITGSITNPTTGTNTTKSYYAVIEKTLYISFYYSQTTAGTAGSGSYRFSIPPGFTINTTLNPSFSSIGTVTCNSAGGGTYFYGSCIPATTNTYSFLAEGFNQSRTVFLPLQLLGSSNAPLSVANTLYLATLSIQVN
jgi:hypothetical protein